MRSATLVSCCSVACIALGHVTKPLEARELMPIESSSSEPVLIRRGRRRKPSSSQSGQQQSPNQTGQQSSPQSQTPLASASSSGQGHRKLPAKDYTLSDGSIIQRPRPPTPGTTAIQSQSPSSLREKPGGPIPLRGEFGRTQVPGQSPKQSPKTPTPPPAEDPRMRNSFSVLRTISRSPSSSSADSLSNSRDTSPQRDASQPGLSERPKASASSSRPQAQAQQESRWHKPSASGGRKPSSQPPNDEQWGGPWKIHELHMPHTLGGVAQLVRPGSPPRGYVIPGEEHLARTRMLEKPGVWAQAKATGKGPAFVQSLTPSSSTPRFVTQFHHEAQVLAADPNLAMIYGKTFSKESTGRRDQPPGSVTAKVSGKYIYGTLTTKTKGRIDYKHTLECGGTYCGHVAPAPQGMEREDNRRVDNYLGKSQTLEATAHGDAQVALWSTNSPIDIGLRHPQ